MKRLVSCGIITATAMILAVDVALSASENVNVAMDSIRPQAIRAHMRFLADEMLEGRGTATRGHELAAKYMAAQFEATGLKPAGDNGTYYQNVPLRSFMADQKHSSVLLIESTDKLTLASTDDFFVRGDPGRQTSAVEAPVVFVGFGVSAPQQNYDDYKAMDVNGKIVALTFGAPAFETSMRAYYSSIVTKAKNAVAHGAVGMIVVDDPLGEEYYSFGARVRRLQAPELRWLNSNGNPNDYFPQLRAIAYTSLKGTATLLRNAPFSAEQVFASIKDGKSLSFPLPISAKISATTQWKDTSSPNVVALLPGSDPTLKAQYVVYSAHLDHLGIGDLVQGDDVYHGALDNASGSAALLESARAFSALPTPPRRSILFLSVTGEESGLLGSDYFAHNPTVPKASIVADLNSDGVMMIWPLQSIISFGAEHSSLDKIMDAAARRLGLSQTEDPNPQQFFLIRSDQYSFVQQGIPAVWPSPGFNSNNPAIDPKAIFSNWQATRYHKPQDSIEQPGLDFEEAAKYVRFCFLAIYLIAQEPQRPKWNEGDFFGVLYGTLY
jgi:hypothetical protein